MKYMQNQKGFTLVAALMTLTLLVAVSTIVFLVTTKDLRIVTRSIGEKKAFSAAEAGVFYMTRECKPKDTTLDIIIDQNTDPDSKFSIGPSQIVLKGNDIQPGTIYEVYYFTKTVTGKNTRYNSEVQVDVGIAYTSVGGGTGYPASDGPAITDCQYQ